MPIKFSIFLEIMTRFFLATNIRINNNKKFRVVILGPSLLRNSFLIFRTLKAIEHFEFTLIIIYSFNIDKHGIRKIRLTFSSAEFERVWYRYIFFHSELLVATMKTVLKFLLLFFVNSNTIRNL